MKVLQVTFVIVSVALLLKCSYLISQRKRHILEDVERAHKSETDKAQLLNLEMQFC
jgi:hypothetical protein